MANYVFLIFIAVTGGIAVTLQGQFLGLMDRHIGTLESVFIAYASGGLVITLVMLFFRGGNLSSWRNAPWYAFTAGLLGLIIVGAISFTVPRMGLVPAFIIMTATQFILAGLIDHFGLLGAVTRPLSFTHLAGILFVLLGVWMVIK